MDGWTTAIWAASGLVAVATLVRLMLRRRDRLREEIARLIAAEQRRRAPKSET